MLAYTRRTRGKGEDIPEVGTGAGCHSSAGWGGYGCCTPVAMAPLAAVVDRNPAYSLVVANVVRGVVAALGLGRSWRCMEAVERDCLEGEEESSALLRSSRLLPFWRMCCCNDSRSSIRMGMLGSDNMSDGLYTNDA